MDLDYNVPDSYLPANYNRRNVLNDTNGSKGVNKYVNDEIYNSSVCFNTIDGKLANNPQGAYYIDGKYYFDFPSIWYNSNSVNKAIGLRSINIYPKSYNLEYTCTITTIDPTDNFLHPQTQHFVYTVNPRKNTEEVVDGMRQQMQTLIPQGRPFTILGIFQNNTVQFIMQYTGNLAIPPVYDFTITAGKEYNEFFGIGTKTMCLPPPGSNPLAPDFIAGHTDYTYTNVWNRRDLFVHASFVNYTSFNYLGKNGEFYPKISKIYDFNFAPQKFYFELSYDGMNPIKTRQVDFMVGLCLIVDEKKYNGE